MTCLLNRNGIFYVVCSERGQRVWRSLRTRDAAEARRALLEFEREERKRMSFRVSDFAEDFTARASTSLSAKTISMYSGAFKNLIRILGDTQLKKLTPNDAEDFKLKRSKEVSAVSVNVELRAMKAAFREASRLHLIDTSPFQGMKLVRVPFKEAKFLSESQFVELLNRIDEDEFRNLVQFAVFTLMRLGEIVHLKWLDVDLRRKEIYVRNSATFRVKGGKPRTVPMNGWVFAFLTRKGKCGEFVFPGRAGNRLDGTRVSRKFKRYVRRGGFDPGIHFHSLRHTGISWLINHGVPGPVVQRLAGHASILTTEIYAHVEDANLAKAVGAFDAIGVN